MHVTNRIGHALRQIDTLAAPIGLRLGNASTFFSQILHKFFTDSLGILQRLYQESLETRREKFGGVLTPSPDRWKGADVVELRNWAIHQWISRGWMRMAF